MWAVTQNDASSGQILHLQPLAPGAPPTDLGAPWYVGKASLAFAGSKAVLLIGKYGSIGDPLYFASGAPWTPFAPVPKTWTLGEYSDLVTTKHGVRMIGSEANADYRPVVGKWTGSKFAKPELIGDNDSCPALTPRPGDRRQRSPRRRQRALRQDRHLQPAPDHGRRDRQVPVGRHDLSGGPQITTTTRGYGWVAWAILSPVQGNKLLVRAVRLPALMTTKTDKAKDNKVTVTGPVSCLPVVTVQGQAEGQPRPGLGVVSKQLKLDGDDVGSPVKIDGEKLDRRQQARPEGQGGLPARRPAGDRDGAAHLQGLLRVSDGGYDASSPASASVARPVTRVPSPVCSRESISPSRCSRSSRSPRA